MEDSEIKKELGKIPDVDEHGNPIYKIDGSIETLENIHVSEVPLFLEDHPDVAHGNQQDLKDETEE